MDTLEELKKEIEILSSYAESLKRRVGYLEEEKVKKPKEKMYQWEDVFINANGYFISSGECSKIIHFGNKNLQPCEANKIVASTEKVCKAHLAACQLSHIIEAINKDFGDSNAEFSFLLFKNKTFGYSTTYDWALPYLKSIKAAEKLIETNTLLLKQYFGVEYLE